LWMLQKIFSVDPACVLAACDEPTPARQGRNMRCAHTGKDDTALVIAD